MRLAFGENGFKLLIGVFLKRKMLKKTLGILAACVM
jgi:hypothetical protein